MPSKPKRPCSYPGCPNLTYGRYCEAHQKIQNKNYEKYERDKDAKKRYDANWYKIRAAYVANHPVCELCLKEGRAKKVEEVHHITPLIEGGTNDCSNLISLCKSCHSRVHAEGGRLRICKEYKF